MSRRTTTCAPRSLVRLAEEGKRERERERKICFPSLAATDLALSKKRKEKKQRKVLRSIRCEAVALMASQGRSILFLCCSTRPKEGEETEKRWKDARIEREEKERVKRAFKGEWEKGHFCTLNDRAECNPSQPPTSQVYEYPLLLLLTMCHKELVVVGVLHYSGHRIMQP